jgi:lipoprotein-releasing system permease protein
VSLPIAGATSVWIGWRYLASRGRAFVSFITWVSVLGLGLGVAVLVVVISVMNGFDAELHRRILSTVPHVVLVPPANAVVDGNARMLEQLAEVGEPFRFFEAEGMVTRGGGVEAVAIYGIDPRGLDAMDVLAAHMTTAALDGLAANRGGLAMGAPLARHLGIAVGDAVTLVMSVPTNDSVVPRLERFTLVGTFEIGAELDYGLVLIGFDEAVRRGLARTGRVGVRLKLDEPLNIAAARIALETVVPADWDISDWRSDYGELFRAVRLEKGMMFVLLALIVAIAAFNIVSAQTMLVNEKRSDIAILRTMGASEGLILRLVLVQGILVALAGIGFGLLVGLFLAHHVTETVALLEALIGARLLDGTYFDRVPSQVQLGDIAVIALVSFTFCVLSALHPARRAAALNPAEALHDA